MPKQAQSKFDQDEATRKKLKFAQDTVEFLIKVKQESGVMDRCKKSIRYLMGEHKIKNRSASKGNDVWNKYAEIVENRINHAVAQIPRWKFRPSADQSVVTSDMLNHLIRDVLWDKDGWDEKSEDSLHGCAHAGSGFIFTDVDNDGWGTFEIVPIGAMLWEKQTRWQDVKVIGRVIKKGVKAIKEEYGVDVAPETMQIKGRDGGKSYEVTDSNPYAGPIVKGNFGDTETATELFGDAYIFELWMDDYETEKIPFKESETDTEHSELLLANSIPFEQVKRFVEPGEGIIHKWQNHIEHIARHRQLLDSLEPDDPRVLAIAQHIKDHEILIGGFKGKDRELLFKRKRYKYPFGKRMAYVQDKFLYEKPNTMPIHWRDRWITWKWNIIPGQLLGKTLGHDLISPQDVLNHRKNSITQNINMLLNGIRKVKPGAYKHLKETGKLTNLIAAVVEVQNSDDFEVDFGQPLPISHFQDLAHTEGFMNNSGANEDVGAGRNPAAGTPNAAIENLIQQFNIRTGSGVRHFAYALQKVARNAMLVMKEYLPDDTAIKQYQFKRDENGMPVPMETTEWREIKDHINVEDIIIDVESLNANTRQQQVQLAIELFRENIYPLRKHVLMKMDDPDKWQIMQEGDELDALTQQVQVLMETVDEKEKEINTLNNRLQSSEGGGNVAGTKANGKEKANAS